MEEIVNSSPCNSIVYSPDGKTIATTASQDDYILLWNAQSGETINILKGHIGWVETIAYSPDGKIIASGTTEGIIRLWNTQSGETIKTLKGHTSSVSSIAYSPDGKIIASGGSYDNTIRLWNAQSGETIKTLKGHSDRVNTIAYSPDGKTIASTSSDNTIRLWNPQSGETINTLKGHNNEIFSIAYSPDGNVIASTFDENTIRLWNPQSGKTINTLKGHTSEIFSIAYSPDGNVIASSTAEGTIRLWNAQSGETIKTLKGHLTWVPSIAYSPDGMAIASCSFDNTIRLWNAQSGETINTLKGHASEISTIAYSPDGRVLASGSDDNTIRLWNTQSGEIFKILKGHSSTITSIAYSTDGKTIASGSYDNIIRIWNAQSGKTIGTLKGHSDLVRTIIYSPSSNTIASGSNDDTIRLWNVRSGKTINILKGHTGGVNTISYSPDGKVIASASFHDDTIRLWNTQSGETINTLKGRIGTHSIAYSPDGKFIASGSILNTIRLWNTQSGETINTLEGHTKSVNAIAYSPDGKVIASGSYDNTIRLWDVQSGETTNILKGHSKSVTSIAYSPNGKVIASGSSDNTIRLWEKTVNTRTLIGGENGSWLNYDAQKKFKRGDDGRLLLVKNEKGRLVSAVPKSIQPVPKQSLSIRYKGETVSLSGVKPASFKLEVGNTSSETILWSKPRLLSPEGFAIHNPSPIQRLEPGQNVELSIQVGVYLPHEMTQPSATGTDWVKPPQGPLKLQLVAPEQAESNIEPIPIEVKPPKLELVSSELLDNTLTLSIKNTGALPITNMRFNLKVSGAPKFDEQRAESELPQGKTIERAFVLPKDFKFKKDSKIDLQVRTSNLPFFIWNFENQSVQLQGSQWWMYLGLLLLGLLIATYIFYKKRYQHPMVLKLSATPHALLNTPFEQLSETQRRLTQTNRLDIVLAGAEISNRALKAAVPFSQLSSDEKAQLIAKRLGAETQPIQETLANAPDFALYQLTLAEGFPLNIDRLLLCFPETTASEDLFSVLKQHPEAQARITLIMGTDSDFQRKLLTKTSDTSNKWVAPQGAEITRLLLAPDAETALAEILATQLSLQQISPYRIGGGVNNESVFFGRRELISQIINRDPANYLMAGGRQVGKSTLLKAIERRYEDNPQVECVYLTLSSEVLVPRLASLLKLERTDNAEVLAAQLDERIRESGQRFVFLIDEADRFISQEKAQDYAILNVFRRLSEEGSCTFILAGFWQLYQHAVLDYQSPIRNFGELLSVGELEKPACIELVTQPMKTMNLSYANGTLIEHIVDSCGQRANLIAIACQHIVRNLPPKQRVIEAGDVDKALRSDELRRALSGWVVGETEHEQAYERMVVYATTAMPSFTTGELLKLAKQHGVAIDTLVLDRTLSRLELAFVLGRKDGRWFYRVPLFVDYIAEDSPELKLQAELSRIGQYG